MTWKVKFFRSIRGDCPVKDFLENLDKATFAKTLHTITLLEEFGPFLKPPYSKKIRNKLYELRIIGRDAVRIFYTSFNNEYYLLHVIKKKSQKIPPREIQTALDRTKELI